MKKVVFSHILIIVFISFNASAQNSSDCVGALPFCSATGEGEATVSPGDGDFHDETILACVDNEGYSTWYTFTVTADGVFTFILNPVDQDDDYDWALFNITDNTCSDIPTDASLLASCNSWGASNSNGPTGISTAQGGTGNQNGPGNTNGPPFNEDLQVFAGETYALMVSNWTQSTAGFNIDVSGSTAGGIYNDMDIINFVSEEICVGDPLDIDISFVGDPLGPITYGWEPADLFVDATVQDPDFIDNLDTSTVIRLVFSNGPCVYSRSRDIYVGSIEYEKEDRSQNVCVGEQSKLGIDFTGMIVPSGLHYLWSPDSLLNNPTSATPVTDELFETTTFYFQLTNGVCFSSDTLMVNIHNDTVKAEFEYFLNDDENTIPVEVDFNNISVGAIINEWSFGDSTYFLDKDPPQHQYPGYATYEVELIVKSESTFCIDTARAIIDFPDVIFPNIITPNDDDINDDLWVTGLMIGTDIKIYNRWGSLVYETEDYQHDWNANQLSDGTYYFQFIDETNKTKKGWLQVLR